MRIGRGVALVRKLAGWATPRTLTNVVSSRAEGEGGRGERTGLGGGLGRKGLGKQMYRMNASSHTVEGYCDRQLISWQSHWLLSRRMV